MKVNELIELLKTLDPEKEIWKSNWYHENSPVKNVNLETFQADDSDEVREVTAYLIV